MTNVDKCHYLILIRLVLIYLQIKIYLKQRDYFDAHQDLIHKLQACIFQGHLYSLKVKFVIHFPDKDNFEK